VAVYVAATDCSVNDLFVCYLWRRQGERVLGFAMQLRDQAVGADDEALKTRIREGLTGRGSAKVNS
jgi:hypothetical protein